MGLCQSYRVPIPPARSCNRDIGKYGHGLTDFWCHLLFAGIAPIRHSMGPEKSNRVLGFPTLIKSLYQFYGVPVAPSKVIRPSTNWAFIRKYCVPGRRRVWPTAGNRHTAATFRAPQLIYKSWSIAYDPCLTSRRPSPKPKVSKSTRFVIDKTSLVQLKTLKKRY